MKRRPILGMLNRIENRDALVGPRSSEAPWPDADAIVGNPPFLGGKRLKTMLGDEYVETLFEIYRGRVPAEADLVSYWFGKAGDWLGRNKQSHVGLVATNSIRGGANRRVLQRLRETLTIFEAWDDEPWVIDGAAVRVSLIAFAAEADAARHSPQPRLDGETVEEIHADLSVRRSSGGVDLTRARRLAENRNVCFMGDTKGGAFDIPGDLARQWLTAPLNPNGRPNSDVLKPWVNGMDVTRRSRDMWIIDFGWQMSEQEAALYELPFAWCLERVKPVREANRREHYRTFWWRHVEPRPGMWRALGCCSRFIVTPEVSKQRVFAYLQHPIVPDHKLQVIVRSDDTTFGILLSHIHWIWSIGVGSWHGVGNDPRYTISTTFDCFPFPDRMAPTLSDSNFADDPRAQAIANAAKRLDELRNTWLNPPDLAQRVPEVVAGFPDRIVPVSAKAAKELKKRTLTSLYNARPQWLADAHRALDEAVAAAYGWPADLSDDEILKRLLDLNLERAARQE
jgi:type II restriction/modification system DNA methylase subunit YeeA